jgi:putative ABC transport system permease protein
MNAGWGLKEGGPASGESPAAGRLRTALVVLQAAFAVILLTGAGLMVRSFHNLQHMDLGFDPGGKMTVELSLPESYQRANPAARIQLLERLEEVIQRVPGVRGVSYAESLLDGGYFTSKIRMADGTLKDTKGNITSPNFQEVAGLRMLGGRWLSTDRAAREIVVNESFAKERFGRENPVGRMLDVSIFGSDKPAPHPIVGVVSDVRTGVTRPAEPEIYVAPWDNPGLLSTLVISLSGSPPPNFARDVRKALYSVEPLISTYAIRSVEQKIVDYTWAQRRAYFMLRMLAAAALFLTVIGLFSVISVSVNSRMPEFGIRMAVGATSPQVAGLVLRRGMGASLAGVLLGIAGAAGLTRYLASLLIETKPYDPWVYGAVSAVLLGAGLAACLLPARRAARADLLKLLKSQ